MPRPSPQTQRVRWILDFLAAEPGRPVSLAQIARHLGVSKATCLPMVAELTTGGWLVRHPTTKAYRLGPALIGLGRAAEAASDLRGHLRPRLTQLADETGLDCQAWSRSDRSVVLTEVVSADGERNDWFGLGPGHRLDLAPPLGAACVIWSGDAALDEWLTRSPTHDLDAARSHYGPAVDQSRRRGFVVEIGDPLDLPTFLLTQRLPVEYPNSFPELADRVADRLHAKLDAAPTLVEELAPRHRYEASSINAPVFGPTGLVDAVVCVMPDGDAVDGDEIHELGLAVRAAALDLSALIGGKVPASFTAAPQHL